MPLPNDPSQVMGERLGIVYPHRRPRGTKVDIGWDGTTEEQPMGKVPASGPSSLPPEHTCPCPAPSWHLGKASLRPPHLAGSVQLTHDASWAAPKTMHLERLVEGSRPSPA